MASEEASEQGGNGQREVISCGCIWAIFVPPQHKVQLTQPFIQRYWDDGGYWAGDLVACLSTAKATRVTRSRRTVANVAHPLAHWRHGGQITDRRIC